MSSDTPQETKRFAVPARRARELTESRGFGVAVMSAILGNAVLLGLETYAGFAARQHVFLGRLENGFLAFFTFEVALRVVAHLDRPKEFFRNPWNLFDALVVIGAFLPVLGDNTTLLRLLRLFRVLRTARYLPQLRVIVVALGKSAPGTVSFLMVGTLMLYVYAMIGWLCFGTTDPEHYGSLGRAAVTLFILMSLDGLGDAIHAGLAISPWSLTFYASYVLLSSFILVNMLIGVVINSMEEARESEGDEGSGDRPDTRAAPPAAPGAHAAHTADVRDRIGAARQALEAAERILLEVPVQPRPESTAGRTLAP
ncbi:ion transporter [Streptomyces sp. NPDC050095]|uniref:ion transporter n=1 Tax=unclassified Streptomyces TaxID=2593676 RepID=UPI003425655A